MASVKIGRLYASGRLINSTVTLSKQGASFGRTTRQLVYLQKTHPARFSNISTSSSLSPVRCLSTSSSCQQNLPHFKESQEATPSELPHFKGNPETAPPHDDRPYLLPHPIWTEDDVFKVEITHEPPKTKVDKAAYYSVQLLRTAFDLASLYKIGPMTESKWLTRIVMLETVAGVPGMIGGMARHLKSLRRLSRDHGWIHTLLEEAENERMHLMTALELKEPGILFRGVIMAAQGVFVNMFFIAYLLSPRFCHRFVGYLEEEAVKTYTYCLECIDNGKLPEWQHMKAPPIAATYWRLKEGATMRDVILAIRADEAHHRVVNHTLSTMQINDPNPFHPGERKL